MGGTVAHRLRLSRRSNSPGASRGQCEKEAYAYTRGNGYEPQNTKRHIPQSLSCTECASPTNPHSLLLVRYLTRACPDFAREKNSVASLPASLPAAPPPRLCLGKSKSSRPSRPSGGAPSALWSMSGRVAPCAHAGGRGREEDNLLSLLGQFVIPFVSARISDVSGILIHRFCIRKNMLYQLCISDVSAMYQ